MRWRKRFYSIRRPNLSEECVIVCTEVRIAGSLHFRKLNMLVSRLPCLPLLIIFLNKKHFCCALYHVVPHLPAPKTRTPASTYCSWKSSLMLLLPSPTMKFWRRSEQKYIPRIRMYTLSRQAQPLPPPIRKRLIMHLFIKKMLEGLCWCSSKDFLIPSYLEIYTLHALTKIIGIIVFHTKSLQLITKVLHLNTVTRMKLPRFRPSCSVSRHWRLLAVACSLTSLKVSHAFLGSVMPPTYIWGRILSATDTVIACIAPPDQKKMKMASYSPHPPVYLKQLSNIPGPSRRTLPLHSNLHNFREWTAHNRQARHYFLMQKKKNLTIWFWRRIHVHGILSRYYFQRHCSSVILCVYS